MKIRSQVSWKEIQSGLSNHLEVAARMLSDVLTWKADEKLGKATEAEEIDTWKEKVF